jgi:type III secretory pathway component EscS
METRRWTNPSQPQTLQFAVWLLYLNAVFGLLLGSFTPWYEFGRGVGLLAFAAMAVSGFMIANDKRWGYFLAIAVTVGEIVLLFAALGDFGNLNMSHIIFLLFTGARAALLLHPMSRDYQRVWFK